MKRITLNTLAALTVLVGGWTLATPHEARGQGDEDEACCSVGDKECCGDVCRASGDNCSSCTGFWGCLFF